MADKRQKHWDTLMSFELSHLLHGVVVVDAHDHVIRTADNPLLACDELGRTHCYGTLVTPTQTTWRCDGSSITRKVGDFEGFDKILGLVVPDVNVSIVEGSEDPRLARVKVH